MNINLTLIGQLLAFVVFVGFTMRYVWPPLAEALETRRKKIADGLAAAERGAHEQRLAEERAKELLKKAKADAAEIVANAQRRANEVIDAAKQTAREEAERIKAAAQSEVDASVHQAREALRKQLGSLIIAGAEQVLGREIDAKAHGDIVQDLASKL